MQHNLIKKKCLISIMFENYFGNCTFSEPFENFPEQDEKLDPVIRGSSGKEGTRTIVRTIESCENKESA